MEPRRNQAAGKKRGRRIGRKSGAGRRPTSLNGLDFFEARDFFEEHLFHPLFQGHLRHGAAFAGSRKTDFDHAVIHFNEFNIAPITLEHGTNLFQG
jgi:hypothetical protein